MKSGARTKTFGMANPRRPRGRQVCEAERRRGLIGVRYVTQNILDERALRQESHLVQRSPDCDAASIRYAKILFLAIQRTTTHSAILSLTNI
jgi:hypothetical protein